MPGIAPDLLRAATESVASRGLRGASLTDVATRAGVSRATAYRAFGDRDAMLVAVLTDELDRGLRVFERRVADSSCGEALVRAWLDHTLDVARNSPVLGAAVAQEPGLLLRMLMSGADGSSLIGYATTQATGSLQRLGAEELFGVPLANVAEILVRTSFSILLDPVTSLGSRDAAVTAICRATGVAG